MAYQANIPQPNDPLSKSQADILGNFQALAPIVAAGVGQFSIFQFQAVNPPIPAAGNQFVMYEANGAGGQQELWIQKNTGNTDAATRYDFTGAGYSPNGWTRLPSGILLKWGSGNTSGLNNVTTITFPVGGTIPAFTTIYSMQVTTAYINITDAPNGFVRLNNFTAPWTQFTVYGSNRSSSGPLAVAFQYLAIGI